MKPSTRTILIGTAIVVVAVVRHLTGSGTRHRTPGGSFVGDAVAYDRLTRVLMGSFYRGVAVDISSSTHLGAQVLEVGCGPGHLSVLLAGQQGLKVTGLDLDRAMIERARANAEMLNENSRPSFFVGDVAEMPFPDQSFDLVVTTLSMHHWADPTGGLLEINRVLRPTGKAMIWDLRPGLLRLHRHRRDLLQEPPVTSLQPVRATPWEWPWRMKLMHRAEFEPGPTS